LKKVIAELDKISQYIEDFGEPWAINIVWRLDKIAQQLEEKENALDAKLANVSKSVLSQYIDKMAFLTERQPELTKIIKEQNSKNATAIYKAMKNNFGNLDKKDSIDYITNVLKNMNNNNNNGGIK